jgi:hypothetical protein
MVVDANSLVSSHFGTLPCSERRNDGTHTIGGLSVQQVFSGITLIGLGFFVRFTKTSVRGPDDKKVYSLVGELLIK